MNNQQLELVRDWDRRCGDNELTFFPVTIDRRRLLEYADHLRAALKWTVSVIESIEGLADIEAPPDVKATLDELRSDNSLPVPH